MASDEAAIRSHYDEFRHLVCSMNGGAKRIAEDITRFGLVERTPRNPQGNEHARSIAHIIKNDEHSESDPTVPRIRKLSCVRIGLLVTTHYRHELPYLNETGLPADIATNAWTAVEIARLRERFGQSSADLTEEFGDDSDDSDDSSYDDSYDDSYEGSSSISAASAASAAPPALAHKGNEPKTHQHPKDISPTKPQQTEAAHQARHSRILGAGATPPTTTHNTNKQTATPTQKSGGTPAPVHYTDSSTIYDGPIADLLSILESITNRDERAVIQGELAQLIAAAKAELAPREPDYGVFASSIKSLATSKEHADPALIESIDARIASLKKAAARIAAK